MCLISLDLFLAEDITLNILICVQAKERINAWKQGPVYAHRDGPSNDARGWGPSPRGEPFGRPGSFGGRPEGPSSREGDTFGRPGSFDRGQGARPSVFSRMPSAGRQENDHSDHTRVSHGPRMHWHLAPCHSRRKLRL